jgi:ABC-type glycerol-3-phosphate transport system substrate-binding protein
MRTMLQTLASLGLTSLLSAASASAGDTVTLKILNDSADAIEVTVYDMNVKPPGAAIANQRINAFAWIPIEVAVNTSGNAHVRWVARTGDADFRRCGREERRGLEDEATVRVFADSRCSNSSR